MSARELEDRHASGFYPKKPIALVRGLGARLWDEKGREYLDFASGHGVAVIGHGHPAVTAAVSRQMAELTTARETFYHPLRGELLGRLAGIAGGGLDRVFLSNSGAEAVECALKVARLATGRSGLVAARRGFHGRTLGALAVTWEKKYRQPFEPWLAPARFVAYNRPDELGAAVDETTAAVILEAVQGEGGVHPADPAFLAAARERTAENGALLVLDEIQTGMGRTGRMLAREHSGVVPDVLVLGKGLGGGLPIGATLFGPRVPALDPLLHGSTFGGGPVVCAAALATLDVIDREGLVENSARMGELLLGRLAKLDSPLVREVRGLGLMAAVELKRRSGPVLDGLLRRGVIALSAGPSVVRFLPPLCVSAAQIEQAVAALGESLADASRAAAGSEPGSAETDSAEPG